MKKNVGYIVSAVIIVLSIILSFLIQFWDGFTYFILSFLTILALLWAAYMIYDYCTEFKDELEESFKYFKAETCNQKNITPENFDKNIATYKKEFHKTMWKDKAVNISKIVFCFGLAILFIVGMIVG